MIGDTGSVRALVWTLRASWAMAAVAVAGGAAAQQLELGEEVRVMEAPPWGALTEPHLAAHPENPEWLVGGVIVQDTAGARTDIGYCGTLLSTDGGRTWEIGRFPAGACADPWVAVTASGEAVYAALGPHETVTAPGPWPWGLLVGRSTDGGRSWSDSIINLGVNHDRMAIVPDPRPAEDRAVVLVSGRAARLSDRPVRFGVYVARSVNAGVAFRHPAHLFPSNLNLNAGEAVILSDGTLLVSFIDFMRNVDDFRSREGMLERRRVWMYRSTDEGRTFSEPLFVTEHCTGSSYVAADLSTGPHAGRAYVLCRAMEGNGLLIHHSDDQGETWTDPRPIPGAARTGAVAVQPRIAVNRDGTVGLAWVEHAAGEGETCNRTMAAASTDGGASFSEPMPLSPHTCPEPERNGFAFRRWPHGGDYFGWAAVADGRFHAVWSDARRGPFELMGRSVTVRE